MKIYNLKSEPITLSFIDLEGYPHSIITTFRTDLPDGDYKDSELTIKISDGKIYEKYPIGAYLIDTKLKPIYPLLNAIL